MTRQGINERAWDCLPSLAMPCSTFCQMSPLCHPLGLGGMPAAAATMKVGYLPIQLLSFMDPHPAGYIAGSGGVEPPAQSSWVPGGCCCPRLLFVPCVLSLLTLYPRIPYIVCGAILQREGWWPDRLKAALRQITCSV